MILSSYSYNINSDSDIREVLNGISSMIVENKKQIKSIRYTSRCSNCFKRVIDFTIDFHSNATTIKGYYNNCSFSKYSGEYDLTFKRLIEDFSDIRLEEDEYHFSLLLKTYNLFDITVPLSPYYPHEEGMDKEWNLYKRNKTKIKVREYEDKLIVGMPDFIDFMGLKSKYAALLIIDFNM